MNVKQISLALASLALISTGSAYAQGVSANVGPIGASVGVGPVGVGVNAGTLGDSLLGPVGPLYGAPRVLSYPAVYEDNTCSPCATTRGGLFGTGLLGGLFGRRHQLLDVSAFGNGVQIGGAGPMLYRSDALIAPSGIARTNLSGCGVSTMSAVIAPAATCASPCGPTTGLGQKVANPWLDLSLFGLGFRAGRVNPDLDMRPAGL
jgi:hypothetical protein